MIVTAVAPKNTHTMKSFLLVLAVLIGLFAPAVSNAAEEKPPITWITNVSYNSNYLAFGAGIELWDSPCVQGSVTAAFRNGFSITLWGSSDLEGRHGDSLADEVDLALGYTRDLGNDWTLDLGLTYFEEPHMGKGLRLGAEDILYTKVKISHPIGRGWSASAIWENYTTLFDTTYNGGTLGGIEVGKTFKVSDKVSVPFSVGAIYDDGGFGFDQGLLIRGNLGVDIKLTESITVNVGGRYYVPLMDDIRKTDTMLYAGFTFVH